MIATGVDPFAAMCVNALWRASWNRRTYPTTPAFSSAAFQCSRAQLSTDFLPI